MPDRNDNVQGIREIVKAINLPGVRAVFISGAYNTELWTEFIQKLMEILLLTWTKVAFHLPNHMVRDDYAVTALAGVAENPLGILTKGLTGVAPPVEEKIKVNVGIAIDFHFHQDK